MVGTSKFYYRRLSRTESNEEQETYLEDYFDAKTEDVPVEEKTENQQAFECVIKKLAELLAI